jgi:hypothetical protein
MITGTRMTSNPRGLTRTACNCIMSQRGLDIETVESRSSEDRRCPRVFQHRERASPINACVHVLPAGASRSEDGVRFRRELAFY